MASTQGFFRRYRLRVIGGLISFRPAPSRVIPSINTVLRLFALLVGLAGSGGCGETGGDQRVVRVSAAASLGSVLETLRPQIESDLGVTLQINLAGSGTLARQLLDGAPADVVILAHRDWMAPLIDAGRIEPDAVVELAGNTLVLVGPGPPIQLDQLVEPRFVRIAIGDPASVPAGRYAEQALRAAGVWDAVRPRLVTTADVRAALRYAQSGEVDAALVYRSDIVGLRATRQAPTLSILSEVDPAAHDPIVITAGAVDGSNQSRRLLEWMRSEVSREAFTAAGFTPR